MHFNHFLNGLNVFFIGVGMVFLTLLLLIVLIHSVSLCVRKMSDKKSNTLSEVKLTKQDNVLEKQDEDLICSKEDEIDTAVVAVIMAAIASSLGKTTDDLIVRSLRRVDRQ